MSRVQNITKNMKMCPNCNNCVTDVYISINKWNIRKCRNCELLFTQLNKSHFTNKRSFYTQTYIDSYKSRELLLKSRFKIYLNFIEKHKKGGKLLDIGTGIGFFIEVVSQSSKNEWDCFGLEPNNFLIQHANTNTKSKIINGSLQKLPFKNESFDCVTCFDVLEHDNNLIKNLNEIRRILKKNGILVIQSPNYQSLMAYITKEKWDWWAPPDHELHMSYKFLLKILHQNSFNVLEKFTYEKSSDFLINVKGAITNKFFLKIFFLFSLPILITVEKVCSVLGYGALSFIVVYK